MPTRFSLRIALSVGLVAATALALQVLLTRLLAAELFYHFGFLAISLGLLGTGAGAICVYLRPAWFSAARLDVMLGRWCAILSALLLVVPLILVRIHFGSGTTVSGQFAAAILAVCVLTALPFTAAGIVIALAIRASTSWLGRLYAFDLAGAAVLRRFAGLFPDSVPWAWGINGLASVLASALGVAVAIAAGSVVATLVAAGFYLLALVHVLVGRWPGSAPAVTVDEAPLRAPVGARA